MMFEDDWLEKVKMGWTSFPQEAKCPKCGWYDLTREVIDQIAETSGGSQSYFELRMSQAACKCIPPHRVTPEQPTQQRLPYRESE